MLIAHVVPMHGLSHQQARDIDTEMMTDQDRGMTDMGVVMIPHLKEDQFIVIETGREIVTDLLGMTKTGDQAMIMTRTGDHMAEIETEIEIEGRMNQIKHPKTTTEMMTEEQI